MNQDGIQRDNSDAQQALATFWTRQIEEVFICLTMHMGAQLLGGILTGQNSVFFHIL